MSRLGVAGIFGRFYREGILIGRFRFFNFPSLQAWEVFFSIDEDKVSEEELYCSKD